MPVQVCEQENCSPGKPQTHIREHPLLLPTTPQATSANHTSPNPPAFHHRLLLWDCPSECDHTCQTIITTSRLAANKPVVQFHGKWPFTRILGIQEPFSVLFSALNLWAHLDGLHKIRTAIPAASTLRPFYIVLAYVGVASWAASCLFHTRDFRLTEELDYLGAGLNVLYGLYYTAVHHFRLDRPTPRRRSVLRAWTLLCVLMYVGHVAYLKLWRWDYSYNMAANVVCGLVTNVLWSRYSWTKYAQSRRSWAMWPGFAVAWIMLAMSLELFDFAPVLGMSLDAHSLWHLGTVGPTVLLYK